MDSIVAVERCSSYEPELVFEAIENALNPLGGILAFVKPGDKVILKPNLLAGKPADRAVTTHPAVVEAVARMVLDCGAKPVIGDSPPLPNAHRVAKKCGIADVAERLGIPILHFRKPTGKSRYPQIKTAGVPTPDIEKNLLDADVVINLPKLKAHQQMLVTCAVKNNFGCVIGRRKALWHFKLRRGRDPFAVMLLGIYERVGPELTIVDAIVGMEGFGPMNGNPKPVGLILAGKNAVAIDRVVDEILGIDWRDDSVLRMAHKLGFPCAADLNSIMVKGIDIDAVKVDSFHLPALVPIGFSIPHLIKGIFKHVTRTLRSRHVPS